MKEIVPSLLSADFSKLGDEIKSVEKNGAKRLHLDIMDGHFVPNITFGPMIVSAIRKLSYSHLEAHLMIEHPEKYLDEFISAGSDTVIIHLETTSNPELLLRRIKRSGKRAGISLNPETSVENLSDALLPEIDHILIMTVHPGFGGQSMIKESLDKSRILSGKIMHETLIEIDGGVSVSTIPLCREFPIDLYVAGSAVFAGNDSGENFRKLTKLLRET